MVFTPSETILEMFEKIRYGITSRYILPLTIAGGLGIAGIAVDLPYADAKPTPAASASKHIKKGKAKKVVSPLDQADGSFYDTPRGKEIGTKKDKEPVRRVIYLHNQPTDITTQRPQDEIQRDEEDHPTATPAATDKSAGSAGIDNLVIPAAKIQQPIPPTTPSVPGQIDYSKIDYKAAAQELTERVIEACGKKDYLTGLCPHLPDLILRAQKEMCGEDPNPADSVSIGRLVCEGNLRRAYNKLLQENKEKKEAEKLSAESSAKGQAKGQTADVSPIPPKPIGIDAIDSSKTTSRDKQLRSAPIAQPGSGSVTANPKEGRPTIDEIYARTADVEYARRIEVETSATREIEQELMISDRLEKSIPLFSVYALAGHQSLSLSQRLINGYEIYALAGGFGASASINLDYWISRMLSLEGRAWTGYFSLGEGTGKISDKTGKIAGDFSFEGNTSDFGAKVKLRYGEQPKLNTIVTKEIVAGLGLLTESKRQIIIGKKGFDQNTESTTNYFLISPSMEIILETPNAAERINLWGAVGINTQDNTGGINFEQGATARLGIEYLLRHTDLLPGMLQLDLSASAAYDNLGAVRVKGDSNGTNYTRMDRDMYSLRAEAGANLCPLKTPRICVRISGDYDIGFNQTMYSQMRRTTDDETEHRMGINLGLIWEGSSEKSDKTAYEIPGRSQTSPAENKPSQAPAQNAALDTADTALQTPAATPTAGDKVIEIEVPQQTQ